MHTVLKTCVLPVHLGICPPHGVVAGDAVKAYVAGDAEKTYLAGDILKAYLAGDVESRIVHAKSGNLMESSGRECMPYGRGGSTFLPTGACSLATLRRGRA